MDAIKLSTRQILDRNRNRTVPSQLENVKLLLHNVRSMHNVGAVFRNADAFGVSEIIITGYTPQPPRPEITKTALGAEKFVNWNYFGRITDAIQKLKENDYHLLGVEQTQNSIDFTTYSPPKDRALCLVFGNEVTGIDQDLLPSLDEFVEIPQYGRKHSLNVSVTTGIALYALLVKFT